jgi:tetratricopeptide (TPR) repeat protein
VSQSAPIPEVEREAAELAALQRVLKISRGTFSLSVAVCNNVPLRNHIIQKARSSCPGIEVLSVPEGVVDVYGWVLSQARSSDPPALFIVEIDRSIRSADKTYPVLASLNASKDLWPKRFSCPVIVWMPEYAATLLSIHARDFWARKSHQFHFSAEPMSAMEVSRTVFHGGMDWAVSLDADRKQFRIAELQQRLAEIGDSPGPELAPHALDWMNELGVLFWFTGKIGESVAVHERALLLAQALQNKEATAIALGNLGLAYADLGETRRAIEFHEKALVIDREIGDRRGEGNDLGNLGNAYLQLGDARRAIEFYKKCLTIHREIGDRGGERADLGNLGLAYAAVGETRRAIEFYEKALVLDREIGDRGGEGADIGNLGNAYLELGDARRAIEFYEKALVLDREIGDRRGECNTLGNLGNAYLELGDARRAIELYEKRLVIARDIDDRRGEGNGLWNMALALEKLGQRPEAIRRGEEALDIMKAIEDPDAEKVRRILDEWRKG